jgi:cell division protein FtsB
MDEKPINDREHSRRRMERAAKRDGQRARGRLVSIFAAGLAIAGLASSIAALIFADADRTRGDLIHLAASQPRAQLQLAEQQQQLAQLRVEIQRLHAQTPTLSGGRPAPDELRAVTDRLDLIEAEQKRLGVVITDSPEKAMSIPLMRRDIEEIKGSQTQVVDALKREIDRVYDLNKWIIGGLAAGVLGLLVRDLIRGRRERPDSST